MTPKQIRSLKKRFGKQFERMAKMVSRFKKLPVVRRKKVNRELKRDLRREERVIVRLQKRCSRIARAA